MIYLDSLGYNPNPKSNEQSIGLSVAKLSEKYGVGKKRVEAVIRLMNEEEGWKRDGKVSLGGGTEEGVFSFFFFSFFLAFFWALFLSFLSMMIEIHDITFVQKTI
jgi:hypothetical protein